MNEAQFTAGIRKKLVGSIYPLKLNLRFAIGVPDAWYSGSKTDLWVEYKYLKTMPPVLNLANHKKFLSIHQQEWLLDRHAEGRNVAVIVGFETPKCALFLPGDAFLTPIKREDLPAQAVSVPELVQVLIEFLGPVTREVREPRVY